MPQKVSEVFDGTYEDDKKELKDFLVSVEEFQHFISDVEWSYLKRLQISDDERSIPGFNDIYFAITDLNWGILDKLITDDHDLNDLIRRLDIKAREGDSVSRERFTRWVLSLIEDNKIPISFLPNPLNSHIEFTISKTSDEWMNLVDGGLAEYIIQSQFPSRRLVNILNSLTEKFDKERKKPTDAQFRFVSRLVNLSKTNYWVNSVDRNNIIGAIDGVIFHSIPHSDELVELLAKNIQVIAYDGTGEKLAGALADNYQKEHFKAVTFDNNIFTDKSGLYIGAYSFAGSWLQRAPFTRAPITLGKIQLTLQTIALLHSLSDLSNIKARIPNSGHIQEIIVGLENHCLRGISQKLIKESLYGIITMSCVVFLAEKLNFQTQAAMARSSLREQLWPKFSNLFRELSTEDQNVFIYYINAFPSMLDFLQETHLATLSQQTSLKILNRLEKNTNRLENVIGELINRPYFGSALNLWLSDVGQGTKTSEKQVEVQKINLLFKVFEQKSPDVSKYNEIIDILILAKNKDNTIVTTLESHTIWLINQTNWNNQKSIDLTIEKLKVIEKLVPISKKVVEKLREKLSALGIDVVKLVLSDESRSWLSEHLDQA